MNTAKSCKILLVLAFVLSIVLAIASFSVVPASAKTATPTYSKVVTGTGISSSDVKFEDDLLKITVNNGDEFSFTNELAIEDLSFNMTWDSSVVTKVTMTLSYDSFYKNGNKNADGKFDKTIKASAELVNGENTVSVADSVVTVNTTQFSEAYYKIRVMDKAFAKISFKVEVVDGQTGELKIAHVNQKASLGSDPATNKYIQTFVKNAESGQITVACPIVAITTESLFLRNSDGSYKMTAFARTSSSLTYKTYSVYDTVSTSNVSPAIYEDGTYNGAEFVNISENAKNEYRDNVAFRKAGTAKFNLTVKDGSENVIARTCTVEVIEETTEATKADNTAPVYVEDQLAIEAFEAALKEKYYESNDSGEGNYVSIGTEIEIPTLEDLVFDDRTPYNKLSKTLWYAGLYDTSDKSSSSLKLTLSAGGGYYFYVIVNDNESFHKDDKVMEKEDFIVFNEDKTEIESKGVYGDKFFFTFSIEDDGTVTVNANTASGVGYIGTKYVASNFTIKGAEHTTNYQLYFNKNVAATADAQGWVLIPTVSQYEDGENEDKVSSSVIKKINYDGKLTFTPHSKGSYKIVCTATLEGTFNPSSANTIVRVNGKTVDVSPSEFVTWIKANTASVVFLSIGVLCLAGIIVLLCIKPKEKVSDED